MTLQLGQSFREMQGSPAAVTDFLDSSPFKVASDQAFLDFRDQARQEAANVLKQLHWDPSKAVDILCGKGLLPPEEAKEFWTDLNDRGRILVANMGADFNLSAEQVDNVLAHQPANGLGRLIKTHIDVALCKEVSPPDKDLLDLKSAPPIHIPKRLTIRSAQKCLRDLGFVPKINGRNSKHNKWVSPDGKSFIVISKFCSPF